MPFPPTHPALFRALQARGYDEPTPVQSAVLDAEAGRDLLVSAQTGSGKTVAYGLGFADTLLGQAERFGPPAAPLALVIAPTRELAMQVHGELAWLYAETGARVVACVGGMDARREARELARGCHIVVATPGRLRDHLERSQLDPSGLRVVVLDEADEMLDLGFREDLEFILDHAPDGRRTLLFSATLAREIVQLARRYQRNALRLDLGGRDVPHGDIEYRAVRVAPDQVAGAVVNLLRFFESRAAIVFCATRDAVRATHATLAARGFAAVALSGELSQAERTNALEALRDGRARVLVATDVAARGLDLPDLGLVVHFDLPTNRAVLLHRSGRTGRAGRKGISVLVVPFTKRRRAEMLLSAAGVAASWSAPPSADEIGTRDEERLLADPVFTAPPSTEEADAARTLLAGMSAEQVATALLRLHRARLPAAETLAATMPARDRTGPEARPGVQAGVQTGVGPGGVWFRMGVGRRNKADPKWLVPLICRLGQVTKAEIGAIRIFDQDTRFEIAEASAAGFTAALRDAGEHEVRIEPAGPERPQGGRHTRPPSRPYRQNRDTGRAAVR